MTTRFHAQVDVWSVRPSGKRERASYFFPDAGQAEEWMRTCRPNLRLWEFVFEDDLERVHLREPGDFGPWCSRQGAINDMDAEHGIQDPAALGYVLREVP